VSSYVGGSHGIKKINYLRNSNNVSGLKGFLINPKNVILMNFDLFVLSGPKK
jgi:hypothetical protein